MIFFLLTAYWIIAARTPVQFVIPAILITIRICYVSRGMKVSPKSSLILLLMIFLFTFWGSDISDAILIVIRVAVFILLFGHIYAAPRSSLIARVLSLKSFTKVAYFVYYLERITALVRKRFSDVQYAVSVRKSGGEISSWGMICLLTRAMVSLVFEVNYMIDQVCLVLSSRGEFPPTAKWISQPPHSWTVPIGDAVLYASAFCSTLVNASLFPVVFGRFVPGLK